MGVLVSPKSEGPGAGLAKPAGGQRPLVASLEVLEVRGSAGLLSGHTPRPQCRDRLPPQGHCYQHGRGHSRPQNRRAPGDRVPKEKASERGQEQTLGRWTGKSAPVAGQLEQKILQALRKAGSAVHTRLLVKECQVLKQELNRVLYRMQKESKVSLVAPATWHLGGGDPGDAAPTQPAQPSIAQRPQQDMAESPGPKLSSLQERIHSFLEASGPCKALHIAKALGMRTAKDVNPDLYRMGISGLLSCDEKSKEWRVSRAGDSGIKNQSATIIYQQSSVNMIYQSQISIMNSEATQIGHGNVIAKQGQNGTTTAHRLPPVAPGDSPAQGPPAGIWGPQDIHIESSILRRVQMGHGNEMNLLGVPSEGPASSLSCSPPATAAGTDASFEARMPKQGPHQEEDTVQRIRIKSCYFEDATIGNSNKMTVISEAGRPGKDGRKDPGEQQEDPDTDTGPVWALGSAALDERRRLLVGQGKLRSEQSKLQLCCLLPRAPGRVIKMPRWTGPDRSSCWTLALLGPRKPIEAEPEAQIHRND
ncbi:Z-DNA-binding protein 1 [Heterocephalus glaber]|uniref:Z-DNA-binding protein 1 n=1 Tax=Heterocephalus glaber TaxID=10181 RepID=G5AUM6_HETGA|nr:Z-DNA-binding protein 1 [Heterocephalus glaber]